MIKQLSHVVLCFAYSVFLLSKADSTTLKPQPLDSFNLSLIQNVGSSCSYTVYITTSCSSTKYTRDQISLSFGDAYGNQIYAPRIDDPSTRAFERCSSDTFEINGPCAYEICYVYFYRTGTDGWKPERIKIKGYYSGTVTFDFNTYIPENIWYGINLCGRASSANLQTVSGWFAFVILSVVASLLL